MADLSVGQNVKQSAKSASRTFGERLKVASARTSSASTKDIDIALVKATSSRFHVVPKEKHVVTLKSAVASSRSRGSYIAGALLKRLQSATDWMTALKTLVVVHRLIRETEPAVFMEELLRVGGSGGGRGRGARVLFMDNFLDTTNIDGRFDFSEWVRAYGKYLDETLEVFSAVAWHVDLEGAGQASKLRSLSPAELLKQMPYLQRLQRRLVDCVPRGQAARDDIVLFSLSLIVRESFKLYKALSEGVINLADCFFAMEYLDAIKGLELYREAVTSSEALAGYYSSLRSLHALKSGELPQLSHPPSDFLDAMESYAKEAPRPAEKDGATAAAMPRRGVPLRKGRLAQPMGGRQAPTSSDNVASSSGIVLRDPGMLLPAGVAVASGTPTEASPVVSPRAGAEEETSAPDPQKAESPPVAPPPIIDLLGFEDDYSAASTPLGASAAALPVQEATKAAPSALDLLSELDFGSFSVETQPQAQTTAPAASPTFLPAIPDAFVVRAAADVYGRPPPMDTNPFAQQHQQHQPQMQFYPPSHAGAPLPPASTHWALPTSQQQQQEQQQQQYSYGMVQSSPAAATPPMQQQQQQHWSTLVTQPAVPASSPATAMGAVSPYGTTPGSGQHDPQLFKQAAVHDPFGGLLS